MPQLPVILSAFANNPDQAHLGQLKAEHDYLLEVFSKRPDLRHTPLPSSGIGQLLQFIQEYSTDLQILHFGGHADGKQLFLEDQAGQGAGLARLLGTCPQLKLVVLNGCKTQAQADAYLAMGIPAVIATTCSVADGQATKFAQFLYRALANHQSIEQAFRQAMGAMEFVGEAAFDDGIVVYRGLERPKGGDKAPWLLYIHEEREEEIKTWTFEDVERLPRLIEHYTNILSTNTAKRLPWGTTFLNQGLTAETTAQQYHDYLSEGVLPYYSLDAFHLEKQVREDFFSEIKLIEKLLKDPHIEGAFISGKGGVGKTRLMLQMGILAHEQGWNVMVINSQFSNMAYLCEFLDSLSSTQHLLLIDYIEECNWFNEKFVRDIRSNCVHAKDIRFLANCRNSFRPPSGSAFLHISLDDHALRADYEHWVIENIVQEFKAQLKAGARRRFYVKKPSFAVFLRYLQQRHPNKDLLEVGDFKDWLIKRFKHTLNATHKSIEDFGAEIKWLLCFPLTRAEKEEFLRDDSNFKPTLDALIKDGWIEESNQGGVNSWRIVQDTVMDELAVAYFEVFSDLKIELLNSFEQALKLGKGKNWMWAIHRIRDTNLLQGKKEVFYEVFRKGLKNENGGDFALAYELGHTALIDENQRFGLIARFPLFFESLIRKVTFALPLSYAMNWYAKQKEEAPANVRVLTKQWLSQWGEGKVVDTALTAKLLSTYVKLYGFDEVVEPLFEQFFRSKVVFEGSYVLEVYFEKKKPITKKVKKYLSHYLNEFRAQKELQFVINSWLNAGGDTLAIQKFLFNYLKKNVQEIESNYVLCAWLNAGGDTNAIQNFLINYLNKYDQEKEAQFLLRAWLNAEGDTNAIQNFLFNYLKKHDQEIEASFVLQAWLNAGGNKNAIQSNLFNYLDRYDQEKEAQFVLCAWLNAGGDTNAIQDNLLNYLDRCGQEIEARFVLQAWLNAGGDTNAIQNNLLNYLDRYRQEIEANFVLQAWLGAGGDTNAIQDNLLNYLDRYGQEKEASFVLQAWLDAGGDTNAIQNNLFNYLDRYGQEKEASFVLQAWLDAGGNPLIITSYVDKFLQKIEDEKYISFVLSKWMRKKGDKEVIKSHLRRYIFNNHKNRFAAYVIGSILEPLYEEEDSISYACKYLEVNYLHPEAGFIFNTWVTYNKPKYVIIGYLEKYLKMNHTFSSLYKFYYAALQNEEYHSIIQPYVCAWIEINANRFETIQVFLAWVKIFSDKVNLPKLLPHLLDKLQQADQLPQFYLALPPEGSPEHALITPYLQAWEKIHL